MTTKKEKELVIDQALKDFLPIQSEDANAEFEQQIVSEGVQDALVVWKQENVLLDGHRRYAIATKLGLPFKVRYISLPDRTAAMEWMLHNQDNRRNWTPQQRLYCLGQLYNRQKADPTANLMPGGAAKGHPEPSTANGDGHPQDSTAERLAKEENTSASTVKRAGKQAAFLDEIAEKAPDIKQLYLARKVRLSAKELEEMAGLGKRELKKLEAAFQAGAKTLAEARGQVEGGEEEGGVPTVLDGLGRKILEPAMRAVFEQLPRYAELRSRLLACKREALALAKTDGGRTLREADVSAAFGTIIRELEQRAPKIVCPKCNGLGREKRPGRPTPCPTCGGNKYIDVLMWEKVLDPELKAKEEAAATA